MAETVDRLFVHCKELVTLTDGAPTGPRRGAQMQQLGVIEDGEDAAEAPIEVAKTNLAKRRVIDNYLEERRLQKQLNDYDFDL